MRKGFTFLAASLAFFIADLVPASATASRMTDFLTSDSVLRWINAYRRKPEPAGVPHAVKALARLNAFREPENAGAYVGFMAGVLGTNQARAEELIAKMLPLPDDSQWALVRAIAYSEHPEWRRLLRAFADRLPARRVMIEKYLTGELPRLFQVAPERSRTMGERVSYYFSYDTYFGDKKKAPREALEPSPELLDTFWGYYFATGMYRPISRIVLMLPWSNDGDSIEKLTLGSMAKFTLASNASRDVKLLAMLKRTAAHQPNPAVKVLNEVIEAAETVETSRIRKQAMAAMEELRRKGPASGRNVTWWGQVGTGAIALGCIAAAATGHIELGLPCVIGGAASSAALRFWEQQQQP
jgi:hypothetical protein